jgi:hypothetical protein
LPLTDAGTDSNESSFEASIELVETASDDEARVAIDGAKETLERLDIEVFRLELQPSLGSKKVGRLSNLSFYVHEGRDVLEPDDKRSVAVVNSEATGPSVSNQDLGIRSLQSLDTVAGHRGGINHFGVEIGRLDSVEGSSE